MIVVKITDYSIASLIEAFDQILDDVRRKPDAGKNMVMIPFGSLNGANVNDYAWQLVKSFIKKNSCGRCGHRLRCWGRWAEEWRR